MLRHTLFGLVGAVAVLGFTAAPQAAQAQDRSLTVLADFDGGGYGSRWGGHDRPRFDRPFYGRPVAERPHWGGDRGYGRGFGGGGGGFGERCIVEVNRYYDGRAFVKERRRICR